MQVTTTTELFEFLAVIGSLFEGGYLGLKLNTTGVEGDPQSKIEVTANYTDGKYTLFGYVTVTKARKVISIPLQDVVVPFTTEDNLTSEVFKVISNAYLLQRLAYRITVNTEGEVKI